MLSGIRRGIFQLGECHAIWIRAYIPGGGVGGAQERRRLGERRGGEGEIFARSGFAERAPLWLAFDVRVELTMNHVF